MLSLSMHEVASAQVKVDDDDGLADAQTRHCVDSHGVGDRDVD